MNVICIIHFNVKKQYQSEFSLMMKNVKSELPTVKGCLKVDVHNNIEDPGQYILVESWKTKQEHELHVKSMLDSGQWNDISQMMKTEPTSAYYKT